MSLSNTAHAAAANAPATPPRAGKVILANGQALAGDRSLESQHQANRPLTSKEEDEYLANVKAKAQAMALDILRQAQAEAQAVKAQAKEEGYQEGMAQVQDELAQAHAAMADSLAQALASVRQGCRDIWATYREDIVLLLKASLEKVVLQQVEDRRVEILTTYLHEAFERLDGMTNLLVVVNPQDEPLMGQILEMSKPMYPDLAGWRVRVDPNLMQGSILVESDQGMVRNTLDGRFQAVAHILENLVLPPTAGEDALMEMSEAPDMAGAPDAAAPPADPAPQAPLAPLAAEEA